MLSKHLSALCLGAGSPIAVLLIAGLLIAGPTLAETPPVAPISESVDLRLGDAVVPVSQSIHLKLDAEQEAYSGSVSVQLEVKESTSTFHFHSEGLELTKVHLHRDGDTVELSHKPYGNDVVEVTTASPLALGAHTLDIEFTNPFDTKATSLYRAKSGEHYYTFTQFEADDGREAFPMWDEPRFKIPYQMTLTVPVEHVAITNTPVVSESEEEGWRTTVFAQSPPMPSYLLAVATGPFDLVDMRGLGVPGRIATVKGQGHLTSLAAEVTPPILKALEEYFGSKYPFRKLDFIAVPEFWPGAMENSGAITYADRLLVMDPATATVGQRRSQARVIAHELAHQWFGNLVTMEWWDDLWLNESFADWMADKITHQLFPNLGVDISGTMAGQRIMVGDARETSVAIRQPVLSTDRLMQDVGLAYSKGKTVLAMFESWLGEETFRRGVLDYLKAREWQNATAADLWAALAKASNKPLGETMATFIEQPGVPRINVTLLEGGKVRLAQERFHNHGAELEDHLWRVPVVLRYGAGDAVQSHTVLLDKASMELDLGVEPDWIHPNASARGYYRWNLPADSLKALAERGLPHLDTVERINLVSNVSALLRAGDVDGGTFLAVLTQLAGDQEPMVVSAVMGELGLVELAFVPDELQDAYGAWVGEAFGPALERFGQEKRADEPETVTMVRPGLLRLLGDEAEDEAVVAYFKGLGKAYLENPKGVDPSLAGLGLRTLARDGDAKLWEDFQARAEGAKTPWERSLFLGTLSAFDDPALQQRALEYAMAGKVRPNEIFTVIGGIARTEEGQDKLFRHILDHWDRMAELLPPQFRGFMPQMASGCSKERLQVAEDFFGKPEHQAPGVERSMERVRETVRDCVALRARESASVATFLGAYN